MGNLEDYGYIGLFLSAFLGATVFPFSSEGVLGIMIYKEFNFWLCIIWATIGNTIGSMTSYYIGYLGKWEWIEKYFRIEKEKVMSWKASMQKYGSYSAFLTPVPVIGDVIAIALGFFKVNFWMVTLWMLIGKFLRYVIIAYLIVKSSSSIEI